MHSGSGQEADLRLFVNPKQEGKVMWDSLAEKGYTESSTRLIHKYSL